jgi:hypothetical protein
MRSIAAPLLALAIALQSGHQTTLRLTFRGPNGETIRPDRVTLLIDWYGGGETVEVPITQDAVDIHLDPDWAQRGWKYPPNEPSRILVEARGYASILSDPFEWNLTSPAAIGFGGKSIAIRTGESRQLELQFRRPVTRSLKFVDQHSQPVASMPVSVYMFWTRQNHCFVFEGDPLLDGARTDGNGRLTIPDGDFGYGVDLFGADDVVFDREPVFYEKVVKPTGPETVISVHRFNRHSVTLEVVGGDPSAEGLSVVAVDRYTGCMDPGIRPLGKTDASGRARLRPLSSDQFLDAAICRNDKELWRGPATLFDKSPTRIVLDPNYKSADPTTDLCLNRRPPSHSTPPLGQ